MIWIAEAVLIAVAGAVGFRSMNVAVAILIPVVLAKVVSLGQFYVPHSGFTGHLNNIFILDVIGFLLAVSALIIGLIAYVGYNFLSTQIDKTANKMEAASAEFIDVLQEPTR